MILLVVFLFMFLASGGIAREKASFTGGASQIESPRTLRIIALCQRTTKANAHLAVYFDEVSHAAFIRCLAAIGG